MKWKIVIPILLALSFFGLTAAWDMEIEVSEIMDIAIDDSGDVFILERTKTTPPFGIDEASNEWRVLKVDETGRILMEYAFDKDREGTFSSHSKMVAAGDGGIYIHGSVANASDYYLIDESVYYLSSDFSKITSVIDFDYKNEGHQIGFEKVLSMNLLEGTLYVYKASDDDHEVAEVYAYDPVSNTSSEVYEITLQDDKKIDELLITAPDTYLFRTMKGEVFITTGEDTPKKLFPIGEMALPYNMKFTEDVGTYYYDAIRKQIIVMDPAGKSIRSDGRLDKLESALQGNVSLSGISINSNGNIAGYTLNHSEHGVQVVLAKNGQTKVIERFYNEWDNIQKKSLPSGLYGLLAGILLVVVWSFYRKITEKRKPVLLKFSIVFIPLMILMSVVLFFQTDRLFGKMAEDDLYAELHHLASLKANQINLDLLQSITTPSDFGSSEYIALEDDINIDLERFNVLKETAYERWVYGALYRNINGRLFVAVSDYKTMIPADYIYTDTVYKLYQEVLDDESVVVGEQSTIDGEWLVALAPIRDTQGTIVGILEIGTGKETYSQFISEQNRKLFTINLGSVLIILIILTGFITHLLSPLKTLTDSVHKVAQGHWGTVIEVGSNDEIGVLTRLFNQMSVSIAEYIDNMQKLNEKYFKFVPQKFFDLLGKESILEVELGDQVLQNMAIVYMNLRDFFKTSQEMAPKESLDYINKAYSVFGNSISEGDGTIGAFRDSGQIGLFESIDQALICAINATEQIRKANDASGLNMVSGICVHEGPILIGVVGEENRMSTSVMSDRVNHAVSLESFANSCGIQVILSESAYSQLSEPDSFELRFLGHVLLKGAPEPIGVYDIFESEIRDIRQLKQVSKENFEKGVHYFEENDIDQARKAFIRVLRTNRYDQAAHMYLMKCEAILENDTDTSRILVDLSKEVR